jgi:hypothetical protein
MVNQACISIGINQYHSLQPLGYGMEDATAIHQFFVDSAGWSPSRCLLMSDTSPTMDGRSTYPDRENINRWLKEWCQATLAEGDLLWVFFSGHGIATGGDDYLVPIDGKADDILNTCISIRQIYQLFQNLNVNAMVFLDANRAGGVSLGEGIGTVTAELAQKYKIPTLISCQPHEFSHESAGLGHGLFTAALLEALNYHPDLNIQTLDTYISGRILELSEHHWKPTQTLVTTVPEGVSPFRPVFSSTTQSSISSVANEFGYSPPTVPQLEYSSGFGYTPPLMSVEERNVPPTNAITKITEPESESEKGRPHWLLMSFLMAIIIGAGGGIYAFQNFSPDSSLPGFETKQPK